MCEKHPELMDKLIAKIVDNSMELAQSPYGNYAIQVALTTFSIEQCRPLLNSFKGKYAQLSMLKFSSNAVEKCVEKADLKLRNEIITEIISSEKFLSIYLLIIDSFNEEQLWELCDTEDIKYSKG